MAVPQVKKKVFPIHEKKPDFDASSIVNEINSMSRRLRMLEERFTNLRAKVQVTDQNILNIQKKINRELKATVDDIKELRFELTDVKDKIKLIIKELQMSAKKEELDVVRKYVEMWEPVNFVTQGEVEKIVEEKVRMLLDQKV